MSSPYSTDTFRTSVRQVPLSPSPTIKANEERSSQFAAQLRTPTLRTNVQHGRTMSAQRASALKGTSTGGGVGSKSVSFASGTKGASSSSATAPPLPPPLPQPSYMASTNRSRSAFLPRPTVDLMLVDRQSFLKLQDTVDKLSKYLRFVQKHGGGGLGVNASASPASSPSKSGASSSSNFGSPSSSPSQSQSFSNTQSLWTAATAPPEAHLACSLIQAAWRGYATRKVVRNMTEGLRKDLRLRRAEENLRIQERKQQQQDQALRVLWDEVKTLRKTTATLQQQVLANAQTQQQQQSRARSSPRKPRPSSALPLSAAEKEAQRNATGPGGLGMFLSTLSQNELADLLRIQLRQAMQEVNGSSGGQAGAASSTSNTTTGASKTASPEQPPSATTSIGANASLNDPSTRAAILTELQNRQTADLSSHSRHASQAELDALLGPEPPLQAYSRSASRAPTRGGSPTRWVEFDEDGKERIYSSEEEEEEKKEEAKPDLFGSDSHTLESLASMDLPSSAAAAAPPAGPSIPVIDVTLPLHWQLDAPKQPEHPPSTGSSTTTDVPLDQQLEPELEFSRPPPTDLSGAAKNAWRGSVVGISPTALAQALVSPSKRQSIFLAGGATIPTQANGSSNVSSPSNVATSAVGTPSVSTPESQQPTPPTQHLALYSFSATLPGQVSFARGELLRVVSREPLGWWRVLNSQGLCGMAPANRIGAELSEEQVKSASVSPRSVEPTPPATPMALQQQQPSHPSSAESTGTLSTASDIPIVATRNTNATTSSTDAPSAAIGDDRPPATGSTSTEVDSPSSTSLDSSNTTADANASSLGSKAAKLLGVSPSASSNAKAAKVMGFSYLQPQTTVAATEANAPAAAIVRNEQQPSVEPSVIPSAAPSASHTLHPPSSPHHQPKLSDVVELPEEQTGDDSSLPTMGESAEESNLATDAAPTAADVTEPEPEPTTAVALASKAAKLLDIAPASANVKAAKLLDIAPSSANAKASKLLGLAVPPPAPATNGNGTSGPAAAPTSTNIEQTNVPAPAAGTQTKKENAPVVATSVSSAPTAASSFPAADPTRVVAATPITTPAPAPAPAPVPKVTFRPSVTGECRTQSHLHSVRSELREYGVQKFQQDMIDAGWFIRSSSSSIDGALSINTADKPFNPFARLVSGKLPAPYGNLLQQNGLHEADAEFFVARNRPELSEKWNSSDSEWVGKASMSKHHEFLLLKSLDWETFNIATFGISGEKESLLKAIQLLDRMSGTAHLYTQKQGWSSSLGLFFHTYPFNSVQALHLHMVDLETTGPTFEYLNHKNLPLESVRKQLVEELARVDPQEAQRWTDPPVVTEAAGAVAVDLTDSTSNDAVSSSSTTTSSGSIIAPSSPSTILDLRPSTLESDSAPVPSPMDQAQTPGQNGIHANSPWSVPATEVDVAEIATIEPIHATSAPDATLSVAPASIPRRPSFTASSEAETLEPTPLRFSKLIVDVLQARGLSLLPSPADPSKFDLPNPYSVLVFQTSRGETEPEEATRDPDFGTSFCFDVDETLLKRTESESDITDTHLAVTILSKDLNALAIDEDESDVPLGSVVIPLASLRNQHFQTLWLPLHGRLSSSHSAGAGDQPVEGEVQIAVLWLHSLSDLLVDLALASEQELSSRFSQVEFNKLLLHSRGIEDLEFDDIPASQLPPKLARAPSISLPSNDPLHSKLYLTYAFQDQVFSTPEGIVPGSQEGTMTVAELMQARTHPLFDCQTAWDVESLPSTGKPSPFGQDLTLRIQLHRSSTSSKSLSAQEQRGSIKHILIAQAQVKCATFADQKTRTLFIDLNHPTKDTPIGKLRFSILWLHDLKQFILDTRK